MDQVKEPCIRINTRELDRELLLQTQNFRVSQEKEPCIGLIQENSMENSIQDSLPYILNLHGPC